MSLVSVRDVDGDGEAAALAALAADAGRPIDAALLRELARTGGFAVAAVDGGDVVGGSVGFLSTLGLHSWATVVAPQRRRQGLGRALKWHQREWALAAGIGTVTWTFPAADVAAARLAVEVLRAEVTSFDGATGQVEVLWALRSAAVTRAWHGLDPEPVRAEHRCRAGEDLGRALAGGAYAVGIEEDGTWLLRGPG